MMNTRIKILCIFLSLIYLFLIIESIMPIFEVFQTKFDMEKETVDKNTDYETFHFSVVPINHSYSFPSIVKNEMTGEELEAEITGYKVKVYNPSEYTTSGNTFMLSMKVILAFVMLGAVIYLPILFFKVVRASTKGNMIEPRVIKKISRIGWLLISMFAIDTIIYWFDLTTVRQLIQLENYKMIMDFSNYYLLVLGTVILLLAEVLKISLNMKEEQDLTI